MVYIKISLTREENFATMKKDTDRRDLLCRRFFTAAASTAFGRKEQIMTFRKGKTLAAALLCAAALTGAASATYTDTAGHWAEGAIDRWSGEYGILRGYDDGSFRPDATITRGAFAGILDRFLRYQVEAAPDTFSDTAGDYWESPILKLNAAGVYLGNNGKALIYHDITRQQAVTMIARAFALGETEGDIPFDDAGDVAYYAKGYLVTMLKNGWLNDMGESGLLRPNEPITRAEVVNILSNLVSRLWQESGEYSEDVTGTAMVSAEDGVILHDMRIDGNLIIAPGVSGPVLLRDVALSGVITNFSGTEVIQEETPKDPEPDPDPGLKPGDPDTITYEGKTIPVLKGVPVNPLKAADFAWADGRLQYLGGLCRTETGIDVSAYQNRATPGGQIDWEAVAADGIDFAQVRIALRGTSSGTLHADAFYAQNIDGALAAGLKTGVYIFSQAITVEEAIEEADFVISLLDGRALTGPVTYDWEMKDSTYRVYGTEPEVATACAKAFCERIAQAGYEPMVYVSRYVGYFKFDLRELSGIPLWYPEYKYESTSPEKVCPQLYYRMDYWQYTNKLKVDGIGGNVDGSLRFYW